MSLKPMRQAADWAATALAGCSVPVQNLPVSDVPQIPPLVVIAAPYLSGDVAHTPGCGMFTAMVEVFVVAGGEQATDVDALYDLTDEVTGLLLAAKGRLSGGTERTGWNIDPDLNPLAAYRIPVTVALVED